MTLLPLLRSCMKGFLLTGSRGEAETMKAEKFSAPVLVRKGFPISGGCRLAAESQMLKTV